MKKLICRMWGHKWEYGTRKETTYDGIITTWYSSTRRCKKCHYKEYSEYDKEISNESDWMIDKLDVSEQREKKLDELGI